MKRTEPECRSSRTQGLSAWLDGEACHGENVADEIAACADARAELAALSAVRTAVRDTASSMPSAALRERLLAAAQPAPRRRWPATIGALAAGLLLSALLHRAFAGRDREATAPALRAALWLMQSVRETPLEELPERRLLRTLTERPR